ncbi:MAG: PAS domain S-box protein [Leptospira sp.]|nr:PAS domain S-box protein [Leptospira sp.]
MGLPVSEILEILTSISRELVCLHNEDGSYIFVSPSSERIIGYKPEELIGKSPYEFFHPDDQKSIRERAHKPILLGKENIVSTFRYKHKDGHYIWLQSKNRLLQHPKTNERYIHTASIDVTERQTAELSLAFAEEKFSELFYASPIGLVLAKGDGTLEDVNPSFARFLGYEPYELLGKHFSSISEESTLRKNLEFKSQADLGERNGYSLEKQYIHKDGSKRWGFVTVSVLRDQDGQITYLLAQVLDIHDRKNSESMLTQTNESLKQITSSLLSQNKQILSFNQIVSHHLRAPISNLKSIIQLLEETNNPSEKKELEAHLSKIADSLDSILEDLIATIRIQKVDAQQSEILSIGETFELAKNLLKDEIEAKHLEIHTDFSKAPEIRFPKEFLISIFTNLISNSIRFSSQTRRLKIEVNSSKHHPYVEIKFTDNGIGIDLERYGDQVFQLRKTFHRNSSGKGLGLFLIRYKMETMGGKVMIKSHLDSFTSVILHFPISTEEV